MKNVTVGTKYEFRLDKPKGSPTLILPLAEVLPGGKCIFKHERLGVDFKVDRGQIVRKA